jgi:hypothetical protein
MGLPGGVPQGGSSRWPTGWVSEGDCKVVPPRGSSSCVRGRSSHNWGPPGVAPRLGPDGTSHRGFPRWGTPEGNTRLGSFGRVHRGSPPFLHLMRLGVVPRWRPRRFPGVFPGYSPNVRRGSTGVSRRIHGFSRRLPQGSPG